MDLRDADDFGTGDRPIDHVELEDGTLIIFDPGESEAWIECKSPVYPTDQN